VAAVEQLCLLTREVAHALEPVAREAAREVGEWVSASVREALAQLALALAPEGTGEGRRLKRRVRRWRQDERRSGAVGVSAGVLSVILRASEGSLRMQERALGLANRSFELELEPELKLDCTERSRTEQLSELAAMARTALFRVAAAELRRTFWYFVVVLISCVFACFQQADLPARYALCRGQCSTWFGL